MGQSREIGADRQKKRWHSVLDPLEMQLNQVKPNPDFESQKEVKQWEKWHQAVERIKKSICAYTLNDGEAYLRITQTLARLDLYLCERKGTSQQFKNIQLNSQLMENIGLFSCLNKEPQDSQEAGAAPRPRSLSF